MHIYIYDTYVNQKKYDSTTARIETRITDLGLNGKIIRRGIMSSVYDSILNEIKKGATTIIAVGNNDLLSEAINSLAKIASLNILNKGVPLGFIPVGKKNNSIAEYLGIEFEENACDTLSARRIETLDLGLANNNFFLFYATIPTNNTSIEIDEDYSIEIKQSGEVYIVNMPIGLNLPSEVKANAKDQILELFIKTKQNKKFLPISSDKSSQSIFPFKKLRIINKKLPVIIDNSLEIKTPVDINIAREKINLIVGKNRNF